MSGRQMKGAVFLFQKKREREIVSEREREVRSTITTQRGPNLPIGSKTNIWEGERKVEKKHTSEEIKKSLIEED